MDKIPALDEVAYRAKRTDLTAAPVLDSGFTAGAGSASAANGNAAAAMAPALADLLDLSMDDPAPSAPAASAAAAGGGNALLDLLGGSPVPSAPTGEPLCFEGEQNPVEAPRLGAATCLKDDLWDQHCVCLCRS